MDGFCPEAQHHALERTGAQCHTLRDSHDLSARVSEAAIGEKQEALEAQHAQVASNEEENKNETAATLESEKDAKAEEE